MAGAEAEDEWASEAEGVPLTEAHAIEFTTQEFRLVVDLDLYLLMYKRMSRTN